jgi:hypothetical protein
LNDLLTIPEPFLNDGLVCWGRVGRERKEQKGEGETMYIHSEASGDYHEQPQCDAQPGEGSVEVESVQPRLEAVPLLKTLRALRQVKAIREGRSAPPAWKRT